MYATHGNRLKSSVGKKGALIASIQLKVIEESKEKALEHASQMIRQGQGADLILLPELWNIGFMSFE